MPGAFSAVVLRALLDAQFEILGVLLPAPPGAPPVQPLPAASAPKAQLLLTPPRPNIAQIAAERRIPLLALRDLGQPAVAEALAAFNADLACVACWPWRIPASLLALPRLGFLNIHPSLLPALRGPEPLFWAFRSGAESSGVTIHRMDAGLDTGALALQEALPLPAGLSWDAAEERAATLGGRLLVQSIQQLISGELAWQAQGASGQFLGNPRRENFSIELDWPARRAFGFMRGTAAWGQPYLLKIGQSEFQLTEALEFQEHAVLGQPYLRVGAELHIQFAPGVLVAR